MAHYFVLVILPEEFATPDDKESIDESIGNILAPFDMGSISGEQNDQGFFDWYEIGGRFDGAVNRLPNYYHEALALSEKNPDKDYGELFRKLASEELKRNSCRVSQIKFPLGTQTVFPDKVVFPNSSLKEMPAWFLSPDFVRTADGKSREIPIPISSKMEAQTSREEWDREWASVVKEYGDRLAVGLDCHL